MGLFARRHSRGTSLAVENVTSESDNLVIVCLTASTALQPTSANANKNVSDNDKGHEPARRNCEYTQCHGQER